MIRKIDMMFFLAFALAKNVYAIELDNQVSKTIGEQSPILQNLFGPNIVTYQVENKKSKRNDKITSLQQKQEALLVAENPTVIQLEGANWRHWFGDETPFLSISLKNVSKLPAGDVSIDLMDERSGNTWMKLKPRKLAKSYTLKVLDGLPINIGANSTTEIPFISLRDLQNILGKDCITGSGLNFTAKQNEQNPNGLSGRSLYKEYAILLKVTYNNIFDQTQSFFSTIVIDVADRKSDFMVDRTTGFATKLKCIGNEIE